MNLCPGTERKMQIKYMPETERPREKMLYSGPSTLSNAELLALIIRTGTGEKSAIQLAEDVISYSALEAGDLGRIDVKELTEVEGIGLSKACSIVAGMELAKRYIAVPDAPRMRIKSCLDVVDLLTEDMLYEKREILMALLLNVKGEVESKEIISVGEINGTSAHPREVFRPAIRKGAASIILAHNHPSGDPAPSQEDIKSTERLLEVSEVVGVRLLDHIIIGNGSYVSLREQGIIS